MSASIYNINIEQGATFTRTITWKDSANVAINLTGYTARMQIRERVESSTALVSLTHSSGITLGGAAGTVVITITATQTDALPNMKKGVYDLELVSAGGIVTRLLQGEVVVSPQVTR
jgi:hypothetical protein